MQREAREAFITHGAPQPSGDYSQVVKLGQIVWAAGQAGLHPETRQYVSTEIEGQTIQALKNLEAVLSAAGAGLHQVIRVGVFLASLDDRSRMNTVYQGFFGQPAPARTTVGATLPEGMLIEVDAMALVQEPTSG